MVSGKIRIGLGLTVVFAAGTTGLGGNVSGARGGAGLAKKSSVLPKNVPPDDFGLVVLGAVSGSRVDVDPAFEVLVTGPFGSAFCAEAGAGLRFGGALISKPGPRLGSGQAFS